MEPKELKIIILGCSLIINKSNRPGTVRSLFKWKSVEFNSLRSLAGEPDYRLFLAGLELNVIFSQNF